MPKQRRWDTAGMNVHGVLKLKVFIIRKLKRRQWGGKKKKVGIRGNVLEVGD